MRETLSHLCVGSVFLFMTVSCASLRSPFALRPDDIPPAVTDLPDAFSAEPSVPSPERWWTAFNDPRLNGLMEKAFTGNLTLSQAWARLRQARASIEQTRSEGRLQLTADGTSSRTRQRTDAGAGALTDTFSTYLAGLSVSYELDLWGRIRATTEAAELSAMGTEAHVQATALLLSAQVATTWFQLQAAHTELAVIDDQIETAENYLNLLKTRQRKAMSAAVDVYQQQQQVKALRSAAVPPRETADVLRIQLAQLLGLTSIAGLPETDGVLAQLPPLPDLGLPSEILSKRPDIEAARLRLRAQQWTLTAARADRLPTVRLGASGDTSANRMADILDNWALNLTAGLTAPILDGGRRRADVERNRALQEERLLAYRDTVLTAFHEVEEALTREHWRKTYLQSLESELEAARNTLAETRTRYLKGMTDYLPVLTALSAEQKAQRQLVGARTDLLTNRVSLCQAIGGNWMADLPDDERN